MFAMAALTGCNEKPNGDILNNDPVAIKLSAGITATTKAPVTGAAFATADDVFRVTAYESAAVPSDFTTAHFANEAVNSNGGTVSFVNTQYYPVKKDAKLVLFANTIEDADVFTAGSGATAPTVLYTITGQEDIMAAQITNGIPKTEIAAFQFEHKLKQVSFKVKSVTGFPTDVTSVVIKNANTKATLDITTGILSSWGTPGNLTAFSGIKAIDKVESGEFGVVMFEPGVTFNVDVVAGGETYNTDITLAGDNAGNAGYSNVVTLTFNAKELTSTAAITEWKTGGKGSAEFGN